MTLPTCHYGCGATKDLRPYGPGGAGVCFHCASATPERKQETERHMGIRLRAAGERPMLTEAGYMDATGVLMPTAKS